MKILFSPSEAKNLSEIISEQEDFSFLDTLVLHHEGVKENVLKYLDILKQEDNVICKLFGVKKLGSILREMFLCANLAKTSKMEAIRLYSGVAYKALDFENLPFNAKEYILENVMIFSNLFGMVRAKDFLPFYKCNQHFKYEDFSLNELYDRLSSKIDLYLEDHKILDLRAEVYLKAYGLKNMHTRIEFLKNGKKVSHYAKYYRGIYLKELSMNPTLDCQDLIVEGLELIDKQTIKNANILFYEVRE
ncbi:peroxide stress protein YaaA [Helicobacter sp. 13S00477-4]|uniref:peroxide stress protein YaaA n=1 Tax=Helicobacter sp. 13S00477-4 TaxID=1905759 RepID=UPI000BDB0B37|nr:peroxide stress protein YaaA [Helicobacter sp. 13S00477-4]PAF52051.1 hypothetical protein BKH44_04040 [Helicobacter sp. 13S00477-4]